MRGPVRIWKVEGENGSVIYRGLGRNLDLNHRRSRGRWSPVVDPVKASWHRHGARFGTKVETIQGVVFADHPYAGKFRIRDCLPHAARSQSMQ